MVWQFLRAKPSRAAGRVRDAAQVKNAAQVGEERVVGGAAEHFRAVGHASGMALVSSVS